MKVAQLDADYDLRLGPASALGWLMPVALSSVSVERLCSLTRLPAAAISALAGADWVGKVRGAPYCGKCVFLNPLEVESPYWKREWLSPGTTICRVHQLPLVLLKAREVRAARNTPDLIARVGRQERQRRALARSGGIGRILGPIGSI